MQIALSDGATCVISDDRHHMTKLLGLAGGLDFVLSNIARYIQLQEEKEVYRVQGTLKKESLKL